MSRTQNMNIIIVKTENKTTVRFPLWDYVQVYANDKFEMSLAMRDIVRHISKMSGHVPSMRSEMLMCEAFESLVVVINE